MEKRVLGYLRAFDPDFIVGDAKTFPEYLASANRPIISREEIWAEFEKDREPRAPNYGVGIFELLNDVYRDYFEFQRRFPYQVVLPDIPKKHELFWAAVVGELPTQIRSVVESYYSKALDFNGLEIEAESFASIVEPRVLFPR